MRSTITLVLLLCACRPDVGKAIVATERALGATRIVIDQSTELHAAATRHAIDACVAQGRTKSEDDRRACLTEQGFSPEQIANFEQALGKVGEAYDMMVDALELMREGWKDLEPHINAMQ